MPAASCCLYVIPTLLQTLFYFDNAGNISSCDSPCPFFTSTLLLILFLFSVFIFFFYLILTVKYVLISAHTNILREVVKVERLKDAGCKEEFEDGIKEEWRIHKERELGNVEEEWMAFKNAVIRCASRVCGMKRLSKREIRKGSEWWNEEVARLMTNDVYSLDLKKPVSFKFRTFLRQTCEIAILYAIRF